MLSNLKHRTGRAGRAIALLTASLGLGMSLPAIALSTGALTALPQRTIAAAPAQEASDKDVILFRNGNQVEGEILEETPTTIRMRVMVAGIGAETTYNKTDVLAVTRAAQKGDGKTGGDGESDTKPAPAGWRSEPIASASTPEDPNQKKVYVIELTGRFGKDISETPLRQVVQEAARLKADHLIFVMDNDWSVPQSSGLIERKEDDTDFSGLWRAKDMRPILVEEIPREWSAQGLQPPKMVFWVKQAMGGAAFLPLNSPNIYFHSDGRMGGIGHLASYFGGDEVVRQKMIAASLSAVEGMAITGGYDPKLVRAMALTEYVLSVRFSGGRAIFSESMPTQSDEILLTDDGKEGNKDTIQELARGDGNDVLTLKPELALKLGVSKGTVDTLDELISQLGIIRNHTILNGRSDYVFRQWRNNLDDAMRQLPRMWREYGEIQVNGERRERQQARSRQISALTQMIQVIDRWKEAFDPREVGVPTREQMEILQQQIRMQQMADRR